METPTRTQNTCLLILGLFAALLSQNLVFSSTLQDQKNFFFPPFPSILSPPVDPTIRSPPVDPNIGSPPVTVLPPIVPSPPIGTYNNYHYMHIYVHKSWLHIQSYQRLTFCTMRPMVLRYRGNLSTWRLWVQVLLVKIVYILVFYNMCGYICLSK